MYSQYLNSNMSLESFSLILGGGAARGLAHIGLIKRLEELDVSPSLIVWTSMGALIGALSASGYKSSEIQSIAEDARLIDLIDIDVKKGGIKGKRIVKFLEKYLSDTTFSELNIPLKIVATNIDTGEKVVFTEGRIVDAVRASISIPWLFAPAVHAGSHLVDGGVISNLPIEEAIPWVPAIAMSVQMWEMFRDEDRAGELFLKGFFTQGYHILRRTIQLMMIENEKRSYLSHPEVLLLSLARDDIEYYDFQKVDELVDEWYKAGEPISEYLKNYGKK